MTDYPGMMTPDELRQIADGVANQNAEAELVATVFKRILKGRPDLSSFNCSCLEFSDGYYFNNCDCHNYDDHARAQSMCDSLNLWSSN